MWTVRLGGLSSAVDVQNLKTFMSAFGEIIHVNHSRSGSESIVVFASRESAEAADQCLTTDGLEAIPGVKEVLEARAAENQRRIYCQITHKSRASFVSGGSDEVGGHYWPNIEHLLECIDGLLDDDGEHERMKRELSELRAQNAPQSQVAALLWRLGNAIKAANRHLVRDRPALDMWLTTMRLFADGALSQHCDRFADTAVNELLACLDASAGRLGEAWAETE